MPLADVTQSFLIASYGIPAAAFAWSARRFRLIDDDVTVTVLEAGAWSLGTALLVIELRYLSGSSARSMHTMLTAGIQVSAFAVLATIGRWMMRNPRRVTDWAWRIEGGIALGAGIILLAENPAVTNLRIGGPPVFDGIMATYLVPAALAAVALRATPTLGPRARKGLALYAGMATWFWITLEIRRLAHGNQIGLDEYPIWNGESWAFSVAWLLYGGTLIAAGIALGKQQLRLAALSVIAIATGKVFLIDMAGLVGLWRVASFLGLGLSLIALGAVHRRFVRKIDA